MPAGTQNISWLVLTKALSCQRGHKMNLIMWWPIPTHSADDTKCTSKCVYQITSMPAGIQNISPVTTRTQNKSQHVLTKSPPPFQRGHKRFLNMGCPNLSNASEDTKCFSACVDQTHSRPAKKKCITTCVDQTHPMPAWTETYLNLDWPNPPIKAKTLHASQHFFT